MFCSPDVLIFSAWYRFVLTNLWSSLVALCMLNESFNEFVIDFINNIKSKKLM
jgi:hypothetical protein